MVSMYRWDPSSHKIDSEESSTFLNPQIEILEFKCLSRGNLKAFVLRVV